MVNIKKKKQTLLKLILYFWLHLNFHIFVSSRDHGSASIACVQGLVSFQVEFLGLCWCQMFKGQDWGLASRACHGVVPFLHQTTGWQRENLPRLEQADVTFHCTNSHKQLISPTNLRPTVLAKPLPRTVKTELSPPVHYPASWVREDIFENKTCEINLWLWFFSSCWKRAGPRQHDVIALSAFPNQYTCCALCFLVKKILDTDLTMNSFPPVFLVSNPPYVFLTCWSVFLLSIASHIYFFFFTEQQQQTHKGTNNIFLFFSLSLSDV